MAVSKFFFQSLVSDYFEGLLPSGRKSEMDSYVSEHPEGSKLLEDLESTVKILNSLPSKELRHEVLLQIVQVAEPKKADLFSRVRISYLVLFLILPVLLLASAVVVYPEKFPWVTRWTTPGQSTQFVRYFPLLQGAGDVIELHTQWLSSSGPVVRSFWEEGGLSPDEFEKNFTDTPSVESSP